MDAVRFIELLNAVLKKAGRAFDEAQLKAIIVKPVDRVLQILAGPGSGKTEVLVWRVLYELFVEETNASELLVTTFTRKAATELEVRLVERADAFLAEAHARGWGVPDPKVYDIRIGTIHSLCDELLSEFDSEYMESGIQLVDESETVVRLMRAYRYKLGYNRNAPRLVNRLLGVGHLVALFRAPWVDENRWPTTTIDHANFLNQLLAQHTETWIPRCAENGHLNGVEMVGHVPGLTDELIKLQQRWEEYLSENNILDYGTIQKRFVDRQEMMLNNFRHVFVDEFQDSNPIQFYLHTSWLRSQTCRLTVVGDDDQAIYRFRGSDIGCFESIKAHCDEHGVGYRQEKLETNYRSTQSIVGFCQSFKMGSVLINNSMPKTIVANAGAQAGAPIRVLEGPWADICSIVAEELADMGAGVIPKGQDKEPANVGILMFSTSEREGQNWKQPAVDMREAISDKGLRIYNPRAKTAADADSVVGQLLGLISYLIDPISKAPAGVNGGSVEVYASHRNATHASFAISVPPPFSITACHLIFQKKFRKAGGRSIKLCPPDRQEVLDYVDTIRENLATSTNVRLTMAGFIARLLAQPYFRNSGFTVDLFRQSLFTQLLESNIAPTRLTNKSLDNPLELSKVGEKYLWDDKYWTFLSVFGSYINDVNLDDMEVESFEEHAVPLITFHQSKGLEFDHVYVAGMGKKPDVGPALRTALFSGNEVPYEIINGHPETTDIHALSLGEADRDREVYVALTRAKQRLSLLLPTDRPLNDLFMNPHPTVKKLFEGIDGYPHPSFSEVCVKEWYL